VRHDVEIFIRFGFGIDNYFSVIQTASTQRIMKKEGAWISYGGTKLQGRDKWRQFLIENPSVYEEISKKVVEAVLQSAEGAVNPDEELSEEDQILAEIGEIDEMEEPDAPVEEVLVEGEGG
jgi:recombination protein RecA